MKVLFGQSTYKCKLACLGIFDGVHIGHKHLFRVAKRIAKGDSVLAITFHPHPVDVLTKQHMPLILPLNERLKRIRRLGLIPIAIEFSDELSQLTALQFLKEVRALFGIDQFVVGKGFVMGRDQVKCEFLDGFTCVEPIYYGSMIVSSTRVRQALMDGSIEMARHMLGYFPRMWGRVVKGDGLGRKIGFPTANIFVDGDVLLKDGVYVVVAKGVFGSYGAVMHIGPRPTVLDNRRRIEIHLLDFDGILYNKRMEIEIKAFIRELKTFSSLGELKKEISNDIKKASAILRG